MVKPCEASATERIHRGHHIYKQIWTPVGEVLCCARKRRNVSDRYAVSVTEDNKIVGHLPRKLSRVHAFLLDMVVPFPIEYSQYGKVLLFYSTDAVFFGVLPNLCSLFGSERMVGASLLRLASLPGLL